MGIGDGYVFVSRMDLVSFFPFHLVLDESTASPDESHLTATQYESEPLVSSVSYSNLPYYAVLFSGLELRKKRNLAKENWYASTNNTSILFITSQ